MQTSLQTRVIAVNRANAYANEIRPRLVEVFSQYVGQKVVTKNNEILAKIKKQIDQLGLANSVKLSVYRSVSEYSLSYVVKSCEWYDGRAFYHEAYVYIGNLRDGVLQDIAEVEPKQTDYSAEAIEAAREAYGKAKDIADELRSNLAPFGEYDR